jgi:hypothetical protein
MKNLFLTAILLLLAATTANAQTLGNGGSGSGLCRDAMTAIKQVQAICKCTLTPNEVLAIFGVAKEEAPDWALNNAGVKGL